jgi:hypothetical protein
LPEPPEECFAEKVPDPFSSRTTNTSNTDCNNLTKRFDISEISNGSGCQAATKSPPGPNLQSGSICLFLSGFIFIPLSDFQHVSKNVRQQMLLSAKRPKLPKQKPNKNGPIFTFSRTPAFPFWQ